MHIKIHTHTHTLFYESVNMHDVVGDYVVEEEERLHIK